MDEDRDPEEHQNLIDSTLGLIHTPLCGQTDRQTDRQTKTDVYTLGGTLGIAHLYVASGLSRLTAVPKTSKPAVILRQYVDFGQVIQK